MNYSFSFPRSAWERKAPDAPRPSRAEANRPRQQDIACAHFATQERRRQCVPTQSVGTRNAAFYPCIIFFALALVPIARAQQAPGVGYVFPPGGKAGTTVDVQLGGYDWTPDVQFFVHDTRVKLEVLKRPGDVLLHEPPYWFGIRSYANDAPLPREVSARFVLPADLPPGPIHWRVANANGGSQCGVFVVGNHQEIVEDEHRKQPRDLPALPVTISGRLRRIEEVDRYRFRAERSGPVTCELMARRLGSDFHGVLEIHDANGRKVAETVDTEGIDPRLTFVAVKDQTYVIAVHDLDYRGYRSFTYRLAITAGPQVLAAIPAAGRRGETRFVEFVGLGLATGQAKLESVRREVKFPEQLSKSAWLYQLETPFGTAPDFPLPLSDLPEHVASTPADASPQHLPIPSAITGILWQADGKARYTIAGKSGDLLSLMAEACSIGSTLDLALSVLDPSGKELASNDDVPGTTNPRLSLTLPVDGVYQVVVSDLSGTSGVRNAVYRLIGERSTGDFRLQTLPLVNIPIGSSSPLVVQVIREGGFKEPIRLTFTGLPIGVSVPANLIIPPTVNSLDVALQVAKDAPATASLVQITGTARAGDKSITRTALSPAAGNLTMRESGANHVPSILVTTTLKPPFKVKPVEADGGRRVHRGATHLAELLVERNSGFTGEIVLDMASVQSRHRQGIRGSVLPIASHLNKIMYPVFLPEWLETSRTSRIALVATAKVPDPRGTLRYVLAGMEGQITMSIEGALLKLSHTGDPWNVQPGQPLNVPLKVVRSAKLTGPVQVKLIVPEELSGLIDAEPLTLRADQETAHWRVTTRADRRLLGDWTLTARATALHGEHPVVSEAPIEVEFTDTLRSGGSRSYK